MRGLAGNRMCRPLRTGFRSVFAMTKWRSQADARGLFASGDIRAKPKTLSPKNTLMSTSAETQSKTAPSAKCSTGIEGLDRILQGGLPRNRFYLVQGDPGVGKTTLGLQFLLQGLQEGERGLYVTLSETNQELQGVAASHGWALDELAIFELSAIE